MRNDVHAPPLEPRDPPSTKASPNGHCAVAPPGQARHPAHPDRAHSLERLADHHGGTNLVFSDPEDRGDSFNTMMSAVIVGGVLLAVLAIVWTMWS